jgi:DNA-binding XRE family transcriptional regulator
MLMVERKYLLAISIAVLSLIIIAIFFNNYLKDSNNPEKIDSVQNSLQQENDSCSDSNKNGLEEIYKKARDKSEKGLYAEQLATCYSIEKKFDQAIYWYGEAKNNYTDTDNTQKVTNMENAVTQITYIRDTNPIIEGEELPEGYEGQ